MSSGDKRYERRRARDKIATDLLPILVALFPSTFFRWKTKPKPLKIGIHKDIKAHLPHLGVRKIEAVLSRYTSTRRYLESLIEEADRIGLDGNPDGVVTPRSVEIARLQLENLLAYRARRDERRAKKAA